jgi:hypothetical protein
VAAVAAWLYEPSCGVRLGSFGRFADGTAFANVSGMNGCFVRDWGATHWQPANIPPPPPVRVELPKPRVQGFDRMFKTIEREIGSGNTATKEQADATHRSAAQT